MGVAASAEDSVDRRSESGAGAVPRVQDAARGQAGDRRAVPAERRAVAGEREGRIGKRSEEKVDVSTRLQYYFSIFDMKGEGVMIRPAFLDFINAVFALSGEWADG